MCTVSVKGYTMYHTNLQDIIFANLFFDLFLELLHAVAGIDSSLGRVCV